MQPRIYTYKITFEEVPYYYYGVHKEKVFNEEYLGTPYVNKWCWELYTPKKQILELFDYTDDGWLNANLVEDRLIKPFYQTDEYCLNESCGGIMSINVLKNAGIKSNQVNRENGTGIYSISKEDRIKNGKKGGKISGNKNKINKTGFCGRSKEKMIEDGRRAGKMCYEKKIGIFAKTKEELSAQAAIVNSQRWKCLVTGFITNAGTLTRYQKARGIDTTQRVRIK